MTNWFKARIYGRQKIGNREEVRLKMFNQDGSPFSGGSTIHNDVVPPSSAAHLKSINVIAHDDFSTNHLSDPTWWGINNLDLVVEDSEIKFGPYWAGLLWVGESKTVMRTTVEFTSEDLTDQVAALVRGVWDGPVEEGEDSNFKFVGAWVTTENGPLQLSIIGHSDTGYSSNYGPELTLEIHKRYWLRCTITKDDFITAELFDVDPATGADAIATHSGDWSSQIADANAQLEISGYGGVNIWSSWTSSIRDVRVETMIFEEPGSPGDYWLDTEAKFLYGPRSETEYPEPAFVGARVEQNYESIIETSERYLSAEDTDSRNTTRVLATLIKDLQEAGIIKPEE